jgi:hypothetical protein
VLGERRTRKAFHVEVFDTDPTESVNKFTGTLVQVIVPLRSVMRSRLGESGLALRPRPGASLAADNSALATAQFSSGSFVQLRSLDFLSSAESSQAGKANINADGVGASTLDGRHLDVEDDRPLAALVRENCTGRFVRQLTVPSHLDLSGHANESDLARFAERETVANAKLSSVKSGPCWKVRETVAPGKERLEGLIEVPKHLLFSREGPPRESGRGASHGLQFVGLHLISDRDTLPPIASIRCSSPAL